MILKGDTFMAGSTYGTNFTITTWGESHGAAIGVVVDGCPAGLPLTEEDIQSFLDRRKPGQGKFTTARKEADKARILSGVFEGRTTGTPISILIPNEDQRSHDYGNIKDCYRPGHADYTFDTKYGFRDYRGGGRSSISILIPNEDQRSHDYGNIKDCYRPGHADYTFDTKYGFRDYRGGGRSSGRETIGLSKTAIVRDTQIIPLIQNTVSAITGVEGALPEGKPSDASLPGLLLPRFLQSLAFTSKRTPAQLEISKSRLLNIIWKKYLKTLCICPLPGLLLPRFLQSLAFTSKRTPAQLEISKSRLLNIIWKKYLKTLCICREMPMPQRPLLT